MNQLREAYQKELMNCVEAHNRQVSKAWRVNLNLEQPTIPLLRELYIVVKGCVASIRDGDLRFAAAVTFNVGSDIVDVVPIHNDAAIERWPITQIFDPDVYPTEFVAANTFADLINARKITIKYTAVAAACRAIKENKLVYLPQEMWTIIFTFLNQ